MKLTVALATYNEEKNIRRCLESIKDFADEIVIVDGSSTDKTVEIAREYKAHIIVRQNEKNFHINKQIAIDHAQGDWILQLDADEVVSRQLGTEMKDVISHSEYNGYWMPRKNYFLGRFLMKGGQYPDYTLRLYRRGHGRLPQKDVHEQAKVEGKVGYLKEALLHYPYKDFAFYLSKWMRYNHFISGQIQEDLHKSHAISKLFYGLNYLIIRPVYWFLLTYIRHKGFMDSWQGFVFSLFSALRFPVSYILYLTHHEK